MTTPFPSTRRWLRGRILDRLRDADDDTWVAFADSIGTHPRRDVIAEVCRMSDEGLLESSPNGETARLAS